LVPGGVLYLETPLRLAGAWYPYRNRAGRWVLDPTHVREYRSPAEVRALLAASGLTVDELEVGPIRFPVGHLVLRIPGATAAPGALTARLRDLRRPAVRVPRYREIRCLAVRR
ncbi:MAG TPA: hypothetical protein VFO65_01780, partial [Acidimicrobiales bacterium]|nr:hypothetical protein [Acidimicrobiales bacterium]